MQEHYDWMAKKAGREAPLSHLVSLAASKIVRLYPDLQGDAAGEDLLPRQRIYSE